LTGEVAALDGKQLQFRSIWAEAGPVEVPRSAVVALSQPSGWVTRFADDFETGLKAWKLTGTPALSDRQRVSGKSSLRLAAVGQSAEQVLASPLAAGRIGVNFHLPAETAGARWLLEAAFAGPKGPTTVRVHLAGAGPSYRLDLPFAAAGLPRLDRKPGWHHLALEFDDTSVIVSVDDQVLWPPPPVLPGETVAAKGPGGLLRRVRLACEALPKAAAARGEVFFDDFFLARRLGKAPPQLHDLGQDQLCLVSGDQLFGSIIRSDRQTVELKGQFGLRSFPWTEVRGIRLRQEASPLQTTDGEHVRLALANGVTPQPDEIEGVVRAIDPRRVVLCHPSLGELAIDRGRLLEMRWLFHGKRVEVDNGIYHLGRRLVPTLPVPRPDGLEVRRRFRLDAVPADARLVVTVVGLKGAGNDHETAHALRRGGLRTEVLLNRRVVDYLNRHGERSSPEPRRLSVPLPKQALRTGDNELVLRQTQDNETGRYADCCLSELAIEIPR
jgi:hypothetical protein